MKMSMKELWNDIDKRKPKYSEINLPNFYFVHHVCQIY
jgi:hypothetical protein